MITALICLGVFALIVMGLCLLLDDDVFRQ
jgi:hypothetical protein